MNIVLLDRNILLDGGIVASPAALSVSFHETNMTFEDRDKFFRSNGLVTQVFTWTWPTSQRWNMGWARMHNFSATATWRWQAFSDVAMATQIGDSGTYNAFNYIGIPTRVDKTRLRFKYRKNSAYYHTSTLSTVRALKLTVVDTNNLEGNIDISMLGAGDAYTFVANPQIGGFGFTPDTYGSQEPAEDGTLKSDEGAPFDRFVLSENVLHNGADMKELIAIYDRVGTHEAMWFSGYPGGDDYLELTHQGLVKFEKISEFQRSQLDRAQGQLVLKGA